jgi:Flp pilus assembly pilin Flp
MFGPRTSPIPAGPAPKKSGLRAAFARFRSSEQGDEGVNKILIIAFVAIPLIIVIIVFGGRIKGWFGGSTNAINAESDTINDHK